MAFQEVNDLSCDTVVSLGGVNKKTGKANPVKVEGYYLGKRQVEDRKKKSGVSYIYAFQTKQGNIGVWGKTDLDRKMNAATIGALTRVTQNGTVATPNGDMYKFKVEIDRENSIEVTAATEESVSEESQDNSFSSAESLDDEPEASLYDEDNAIDEAPVARPSAPRKPAVAADAARQAKVQALLNASRK